MNRNELWVGLVAGLLLPFMSFVVLYEIFNLLESRGAASSAGFSPGFRERTVGIIAIAINIFLLNLYRRRRWDQAMRGIVIATSILAMIWVVRYVPGLF